MKKLAKMLMAVLFCLGFAFAAVTPAFAAVAKVSKVKAYATATTVTLSWNKVSGATGYVVQQFTGNKRTATKTTKTNKITIKNLKTGTNYSFRVRAYKGSGKNIQYGKLSPAVSVKPACIAPKNLKAVSASPTSVKLSWAKLSSATGYLVQKYDGKKWVKVSFTKNTTLTVSNLKPNESVKLRVFGYTRVGNKNVYGKARTVTAKPVLAAPSGLKASASSPTTAAVSWNAVSGAAGYTVQRYDTQSKKWVSAGTTTKTSLTATKLVPTVSNQLRVLAYAKFNGKNVNGNASAAVNVKPSIAKVTGLTCNETDSSTASLSWNAVSGVTGYAVYSKEGTKYTQLATSPANKCVVQNLKSNTDYEFVVRAYVKASDSKNYYSAYSAGFTTKTAPAAVTGLKATRTTDNSVSLAWSASPDEKVVERYEVFALVLIRKADGTQNNEWVSLGSVPTSTKVYDISKKIRYRDENGSYVELPIEQRTSYQFKVEGYSLYAPDPEYPTDRVRLYSTAATVTATTTLARVLNLKVENPTSSSFTVSWTKNSRATGYKLETRKESETEWTTVDLSKCAPIKSDNVTLVIYTVGGLDVSTKYFFRVSALDGKISSSVSDVAEGKTTPAKITDLECTSVKDINISLKWKSVENVVKYEIWWIDPANGNTEWKLLETTDRTEFSKSGLAQLTTYQFKIRAYTEGQSTPSDFSNVVSVTTNLSKIVDLSVQVTKCTGDSVYIGWTPNSKASSYKLEVSPDGEKDWKEIDAEIKNPENLSSKCVYICTGLKPSTLYYFRVSAVNESAKSDYSNVIKTRTGPAKLQNVVSTVKDTSIELSWTKDSSVSSYIVEYKKSGESTWNKSTDLLPSLLGTIEIDADNAKATIKKLSQDTAYDIRVSSYVYFSDKILPSTPTEMSLSTKLSAVTNFKFVKADGSSITLSWTPNSKATGYNLQMSENGKTWTDTNAAITGLETMTATVTGLKDSKTIYFRVLATKDGSADGVPSATVIGKTAPAAAKVTVTSISDDYVTLSWAGATRAEKYKISWNGKTETTTATSFKATGLEQATAYEFTVTAIDTTVDGKEVSASTKISATTALSAVKDLKVTAATENSVTLSWTVNAKATGGYSIKGTGTKSSVSVSGNTASVTVTGLNPGSSYSYTVIAVRDGISKALEASATAKTVPGKVTGLSAVSSGESSVALKWTAASLADGYEISFDGKTANSSTASFTATGLSPATSYSFTVRAYILVNGAKVYSAASDALTASTKFSKVTGLSAKTKDASSVELSWKAVEGAEKYFVYKNGTKIGETASVSFTATGLSAGTSFSFAVSAVKNNSEGERSAAVSATTCPSAVTVSASVNKNNNQITLTWKAVTGAKFYRVYDASTGKQIGKDITGTSFVKTDAEQLTSYSFFVKAFIDEPLVSEKSNTATAKAALLPVSGLKVEEATSSAVTISFTKNEKASSYIYMIDGKTVTKTSSAGGNKVKLIVSGISAGTHTVTVIAVSGTNATSVETAKTFTV